MATRLASPGMLATRAACGPGFPQAMFEGALTLKQFKERLESLPENVDIVFYCA